jgi:hypothetical protein
VRKAFDDATLAHEKGSQKVIEGTSLLFFGNSTILINYMF